MKRSMKTLILDLNPSDWPASRGTLLATGPEGYNLPPEEFSLAEKAAGLGKVDELQLVIGGLVALGELSGWIIVRMLISERGTFSVLDDSEPPEEVGSRTVLELAVTLQARPDHPVESVRGLLRPDTMTSEELPEPVRDALLDLWAGVTEDETTL